jgi:hypothetical protein
MQQHPKRLNKKSITILSAALILIATSALLSAAYFGADTPAKRDFYYGVEIAYGDYSDFTAIIDEVKSYTNLVVFGLPEVTINQTLLNMSCDYIYNSGLHFIVLFTNISQYSGWQGYTPEEWVYSAMEKYGDKFLAVYRWDEPGGDQIDHSRYQEVKAAQNYSDAARQYVDVLREPVQYYKNTGIPVLTADYVLYWFDYMVGYDAVLAEFGWNNSREQQIALVRGAARANDKDWGAIVTWTYSNFTGSPFIESPAELYDDLVLAYNNGAKYAVVFNYPELADAKYGILTQEHLDAIKDFSDYVARNPPSDASYRNVKTAYVLPADYGFGFRHPLDSIWGLWPSDSTSQHIYGEVEGLIEQKGAAFDVVCDYPALLADAKGRYDTLIYWNGTKINP